MSEAAEIVFREYVIEPPRLLSGLPSDLLKALKPAFKLLLGLFPLLDRLALRVDGRVLRLDGLLLDLIVPL